MRDNPYEIYTISSGVAVSLVGPTEYTETGVVTLRFTPVTTNEHLCGFRIDVNGIALNKWSGSTLSGFIVPDPNRHYVGVMNDQPKADPC